MKSTQTNPDTVLIKEITNDAIKPYKELKEQKQIDLTVNIPDNLTVYADHNQVEFIIRNLLNNALKFTPRYGKVYIYAQPNTSICTITIEDSGDGIPPEILYNLFKIEKSMTTLGTEGEKGTGLGLILCKEFTEKNGGQILVESKPGLGTKFRVILPLHK
jgi:signal transduction histidine kinase